MVTNREIRKLFSTFSELLQLNEQDERLSKVLAGAAFRIGQMDEQVMDLNSAELNKLFRKEVVSYITELKNTGTIELFDELVQLTPAGLLR